MRSAFLFIFLSAVSLFAEPRRIIKFSELRDYLETSPTSRLTVSQRDQQIAAAESAVQWRNPELDAEIENLSGTGGRDIERTVALSKAFRSPWTSAAFNKANTLDIEAAEWEWRQRRLSLLAAWKTLYVNLQLKQKVQHELTVFQEHIQQVSVIAADRREQGSLSGMENQLLQMSVFSIKAAMLHLNSDIRRLEDELKRELGIPGENRVSLESDIHFAPVDVSALSTEETVRLSPHIQSRERRMTAARKKVTVEQGGFLPEFHVTGGYKEVNDNLRGSVIGLSLPLPLVNVNRASIRQAQAELTTTSIEYDLTVIELKNRIKESSALVQDAQVLLDDYSALFQTNEMMSNLVFSFQEGWITLTDFFSGIEVYADAIESYYAHLQHYYEHIFQLEAVTGQELVWF